MALARVFPRTTTARQVPARAPPPTQDMRVTTTDSTRKTTYTPNLRLGTPMNLYNRGVHVDRYNMSQLILLRASCISAFSQSHDDKSPLLARGGPWAPVSFTFTFMLAGAHMRIRRYVLMETWALGFALPFIKRYIHMETWAVGVALPFIKRRARTPFLV